MEYTKLPVLGNWDRLVIRDAIVSSAITLRSWQRECLYRVTAAPTAGIVCAVMGSGKSVVIALLCAAWSGHVVVTVPTQHLVEQLAATLESVGVEVGRYYQHARDLRRVTVCCLDSLPVLMAELQPGYLWIADEAHRAETIEPAFVMAAAHSVGFSATPYQSTGGLRLWAHEIMRYGVDQAIRDGVLVPMRVVLPERDAELDAWCIEQVAASEGPGVVSADTIDDAEAFTEALRAFGVPTAVVHSRLPKDAKGAAIADLQAGRVRCIVQVRMLVEGVDMPWLRWVCLRRKQGSRVDFQQFVGRGLRASTGKAECVVYDPHGLTLRHNLQDLFEQGSDGTPKPRSLPPNEECIDPLTGEPFEWEGLPAAEKKRIRAAGETARTLAIAAVTLTQHGYARRAVIAGDWRHDPVTPAQARVLGGLFGVAHLVVSGGAEWGTEPTALRRLALELRRVCRNEKLRCGVASDALTVGIAIFRGPAEVRAAALSAVAMALQ